MRTEAVALCIMRQEKEQMKLNNPGKESVQIPAPGSELPDLKKPGGCRNDRILRAVPASFISHRRQQAELLPALPECPGRQNKAAFLSDRADDGLHSSL